MRSSRLALPYVHIPVTSETKADAEARQIRLLHDYRIDTIVLARYMQILSPAFVAEFPGRIINIHTRSCRRLSAPGHTSGRMSAASN
ncbi:Formyltetrahydrofolate deformylase [[Flavobacterium] thermophilum]|nr:Formyltetrahydrofolate deformylase [[Flavobacterium] thermophilum]